MLQNWSKVISEDNDPIPQDAYVMLGGIKLEELRRIMSEALDKTFDKHTAEIMGRANQRLAGLEQEARQQRLATKADVPTDTKTHKRMNEDSCSAKRVQAGPTSLTNFGMKAEPPALPRKDDVLVDKEATVPKPCLSPVEMSTPTAADGLLPAGAASTVMKTIFSRPLPSWTLGERKELTGQTITRLHLSTGGKLYKQK